MDAVHEIGYPAIDKAQQLSAERLGVRGDANRWDIRRPSGENAEGDAGREQGRRKTLQQLNAENAAAAKRSALSPRPRSPPATALSRRNARRDDGDCLRRDRSVSPLPPRHARSAQRALSADITQILRGVRGEAVALDRFLALEVEPAAEQIFDSALSEHAKACSLLVGPPVAAYGIDPVRSNSSTPTTATNTDDDDEENGDDDSSGGNNSGVAAAAGSATAATAAAVAGGSSDVRRRAVRAHVARTPPRYSPRARLPARGNTGPGGTFGCPRPPSMALVGHGGRAGAGAGAGAVGSSDDSRWGLPGRHYRTSETAGKSGRNQQDGGGDAGAERPAVVPRGAVTLVASAAAGKGRAGACAGASAGAGTGRKKEAGAEDASRRIYCVNNEEQEREEDDGEWEVPLCDGQLATDISNKMVGLSSHIRRKAAAAAAAAAAEAGRNDNHRKPPLLRGR